MAEKRKLNDNEIDESDPVVSLQDIIEEDRELETTANAVLGGSNAHDCTYPDGYMVRQALYACATCQTTEDAGVCLACSLECHDGHDLFELYTKRNFRCDCGNDKFPGSKCNLFPNKDAANKENNYNHNFKGSYCTCKRPYPDPDDSVDDEMIQCIICEDWFHSRHLNGKGIPEDSNFAEMICHLCMNSKTQFLWYYNWEYTHYQSAVVNVVDTKSDVNDIREEATADITNTKNTIIESQVNYTQGEETNDNLKETKNGHSVTKITENSENVTFKEEHYDGTCVKTEVSTEQSVIESSLPTKNFSDLPEEPKVETNEGDGSVDKMISISESEHLPPDDIKTVVVKSENQKEIYGKVTSKLTCKLDHLKEIYKSCEFPNSASFWPDSWRDKLCVCKKCNATDMKKFMYLTNISDTVAEYEKRGEAVHTDSTMDQGMRALGGMNRVQQVEVIQGYNDMKTKLSEYLRTFAQDGKVVTEEDIRHFFQRMSESKKPRINISHTCK